MSDVKYWIKAAKKGSLDMYLYDYIGGWLGGVTPQRVADDLKSAAGATAINVHINSPGGDVFDGITIYNLLRNSGATVNVMIDGLAASIASIIAMAGTKISIAGNAMMMIHDPMSGNFGTADELRKQAELLDQIRETLLDTYVARSGADKEHLSELMSAETWMKADQALELGLVDVVTEEQKVAACSVLPQFRHVPERLHLKDAPAPSAFRTRAAEMARRLAAT